jgi:hypothetical protein
MSLIATQLAARHGAKSAEEVEDRAITVRPSSTALFGIDSADRYKDYTAASLGVQTPYDFTISKNEALLNGFFTRIALTEIVFPYYIPNLNQRTAYINYTENAGPVQTLDLSAFAPSFQSPAGLASIIEGLLQIATANGALTCVYSQGRFIIKTNTADTLTFQRGNFKSITTAASGLNEFQLFDLLHMNASNLVPSDTQVSGVSRCRYTEYVDIVSSQLTLNQDLKDGSSDRVVRDSLARIYLEGENDQVYPVYDSSANLIVPVGNEVIPGVIPFTIYRKFPHPKQIQWNNTQPLGNLRFEVYDDKGEILSAHNLPQFDTQDYTLPDWRMTLLVSEN